MTYREDAHISVRRNGFVGVKISKYNFVFPYCDSSEHEPQRVLYNSRTAPTDLTDLIPLALISIDTALDIIRGNSVIA